MFLRCITQDMATILNSNVVASQMDLSLMKLVAINQRGTCKDFIDLKSLIEANKYTFKCLTEKLSEKYDIGNEMHFQLKKSLVYFDDAEKDLNIQMYIENKRIFEILRARAKITSHFYISASAHLWLIPHSHPIL